MKVSMMLQKAVYLYVCCLFFPVAADEHPFDVLLERTPYAQLLKEVILLADTLVLLRAHNKVSKSERRTIEDMILGKVVRARSLMKEVTPHTVPEEDVDYMLYWLDLAQKEQVAPLVRESIVQLATDLHAHFDSIAQ